MSPPLRASNEGLLRPRVARAQGTHRAIPPLLADFFSILLGQPGPLRKSRRLPDSLSSRINDIPDESVLDEKTAAC